MTQVKGSLSFLLPSQVKIWFQNRRTKWKKQNPGMDVNCGTLPSPPDSCGPGAPTGSFASLFPPTPSDLAGFYHHHHHHHHPGFPPFFGAQPPPPTTLAGFLLQQQHQHQALAGSGDRMKSCVSPTTTPSSSARTFVK